MIQPRLRGAGADAGVGQHLCGREVALGEQAGTQRGVGVNARPIGGKAGQREASFASGRVLTATAAPAAPCPQRLALLPHAPD